MCGTQKGFEVDKPEEDGAGGGEKAGKAQLAETCSGLFSSPPQTTEPETDLVTSPELSDYIHGDLKSVFSKEQSRAQSDMD